MLRIAFCSVVLISLIFSSCTKDFDEINTDPTAFTTASDGSLFNGIIQSLILTGNEQFYINNEILYKQTQLAALTKEEWGNYTLGTESMWSNHYQILPSVRELEDRFAEIDTCAEATNMIAMLKIIVAYKTFKMTDMFGDMPFFEAGYGFQDLELLHPSYDSQESIYKYLLEELQWCDENIDLSAITTEPFLSFSAFDPLFRGNDQMLNWQKFANSMRLRYALRMSDKEPDLAAEIISDIVNNNRPVFVGYNLQGYVGESACVWPSRMGFKNESLNWSFREHSNLRMGSNIWHQLSSHDSIDGSGIFDPRAFIFFEGNNLNQWVAYPQIPTNSTSPSGGIPYDSHRDSDAAFSIKGDDCIYSPFNYFIVRDEDFMPIPLLTGAEVHYILAEAYLKGIGVPLDPDQGEVEYLNGISSSIDWWTEVANNSKLPLSGIAFTDKVQIPSGIGVFSVQNVFGMWNAKTEEEKLRFLYTQRWLDAFRQPWEAFALTRRTNMTPREGNAMTYCRLPYATSEAEYNTANWSEAVANQGGDNFESKIWLTR